MRIKKQLRFALMTRTALVLLLTAVLSASGFGLSTVIRAEASSGSKEQVILDDGASLLYGSEVSTLQSKAEELASRTKWDVRLVSTDDANGKEAVEYAEDYYMAHYHSDDGFVCLIDMDNREIYIATSGEVIYYLTDERIEKILDDAYSYVSDEEYGDAYEVMLEDIESYYREGIDSGTYTYNTDTGEIVQYTPPRSINPVEAFLAAAAGLLSALGMGGIVSSSYKKKGKEVKYSVRENGNLNLSVRRDNLINRFVTTRHIPKSPPPSSGSSGGGGHQSSIHIGSGGHSFGGGGRKF